MTSVQRCVLPDIPAAMHPPLCACTPGPGCPELRCTLSQQRRQLPRKFPGRIRRKARQEEKPKVRSVSPQHDDELTSRRAFPSSQAARRDQNRIAQREFRLRKQQRVSSPSPIPYLLPLKRARFQIRDLEASVEILSGGKDEALSQLRKVLKGTWATSLPSTHLH